MNEVITLLAFVQICHFLCCQIALLALHRSMKRVKDKLLLYLSFRGVTRLVMLESVVSQFQSDRKVNIAN